MKRFFAVYFCLLLALTALPSCKGVVDGSVQPVVFESLSIDSICPLFRNFEKPACHIVIELQKPSASNPSALVSALEDALVTLPREGSLVGDAGGTLDGMARAYVRQFFIQYLLDGKEAIDSYGGDAESAGSWMNYEERVDGSVKYNDNGLLSYQFYIYSYAGGAHGNTQIRNCVFDCRKLSRLSLSDCFPDESMPQVGDLLRRQLMHQFDCKSFDELSSMSFVDPEAIGPTENFLIDNLGITWTFDPYEIAAYALGPISVQLSWNVLLPLLHEGFKVPHS